MVGITANTIQFVSAGPTGLISNCPTNVEIDHTVLLIGYNSTHWFIKNSWGTNWGDRGYAYVSRSSDCGIKRYAVFFRTSLY